MADESGIFSTVILQRLAIAEEELKNKEIDHGRVKNALGDIRSILMPITKRHFSERREGFKHVVGTYYPMLQRQAISWLKQFRRRMTTRCSVKHPWHIILEDKLPKELFGVFEEIASKTNYGMITAKTKKNCVFAFTSRTRVRRMFCALTGQNLTDTSFLKRVIKDEKRVEAIINAEKQFGFKFNFQKEVITVDFYFGYWNDHGWPQHV